MNKNFKDGYLNGLIDAIELLKYDMNETNKIYVLFEPTKEEFDKE